MRREMARLEQQREKERLLAIQKDIANRFAGNLVTVPRSVTQPSASSVTPSSTAMSELVTDTTVLVTKTSSSDYVISSVTSLAKVTEPTTAVPSEFHDSFDIVTEASPLGELTTASSYEPLTSVSPISSDTTIDIANDLDQYILLHSAGTIMEVDVTDVYLNDSMTTQLIVPETTVIDMVDISTTISYEETTLDFDDVSDYMIQTSSDHADYTTSTDVPIDLIPSVSEVVITETTVAMEETSGLPIFVSTTELPSSFPSSSTLTTESYESRLKRVHEQVRKNREEMFALKPIPHYSEPFLYQPEKKVKAKDRKHTTHFPMNYGTRSPFSSTFLSTSTDAPVVMTSPVPYIKDSTNMATGFVRSSSLGPLDNPTSRDLHAGVWDLTHWTGKLAVAGVAFSGRILFLF